MKKFMRQPNESLDILTGGVKGTKKHYNHAADNSVTTVKSSEGFVSAIIASNATASDAYLQMYDEADSITVGTTDPAQSYLIPAGTGTVAGDFHQGFLPVMKFENSIKYACTTSPTGNTASTGDIEINMNFK